MPCISDRIGQGPARGLRSTVLPAVVWCRNVGGSGTTWDLTSDHNFTVSLMQSQLVNATPLKPKDRFKLVRAVRGRC